jgi:hypothetical protein
MLTWRCVQAERLSATFVAPNSDRPAIINELITLFDGPARRQARKLAAEALAESQERSNIARLFAPAPKRASLPREPTLARALVGLPALVRLGRRFVAQSG